MNIYVSHLIKTEDMQHILGKYNTNIEIVNFSSARILDRQQYYLKEFKSDMEGYLHNRHISLHGPFVDMSPGSPDRLIRGATLERFNQCYAIAKELKAKQMIFHSGFIPKVSYGPEWLEASIIFWKDFLKDKDEAINIHVENVFDDDSLLLKELLKEINNPIFSLCLDIGHANTCSKKPVRQWIQDFGSSIGYVHLHNNFGEGDTHNEIEKGSMDIGGVLKELRLNAPKAPWSLEVFSKEGIEASLEYLRGNGYLIE